MDLSPDESQYAVYFVQPHMCKYLIQHGADVDEPAHHLLEGCEDSN